MRFLTGIVVVAGAVALRRASLRPRRWGWLLARGVFGGVAVMAYFACIEHLGVGLATLLNYTAPVWSMLFGWWLLGERPRLVTVAALSLTLLGVVFVVAGSVGRIPAGAWTLVGVFSAIASGVAVTSIRAVRRRGPDGAVGESSWTVFASFTVFGALVTLPAVIEPVGRWVTPTPAVWAVLLAVGGLSVAAQLMMTNALEHLTAATTGVINQLTVLVSMSAGLLFFHERVTGWALFGSVLTISGVAWAVVASARTRAPLPPSGG